MEARGSSPSSRAGTTRFVRYLRALRPSKSAEVVEALRTDPQFEEESPRAGRGSGGDPPGFDRLNEELRKAP
jgi:hypothetical protein